MIFDQLSFLKTINCSSGNVRSVKCMFRQIYFLENVRSGKCNFWKRFILESVFRSNVISGRCFSSRFMGFSEFRYFFSNKSLKLVVTSINFTPHSACNIALKDIRYQFCIATNKPRRCAESVIFPLFSFFLLRANP